MKMEKNGCQSGGLFGNSPADLKSMKKNKLGFWAVLLVAVFGGSAGCFGGEASIPIPDLTQVKFDGLGGIHGSTLMFLGIGICLIGAIFGLVQYGKTKSLPVHESMAQVSNTIWETCKTYLFTQGKFLAILWLLIGGCMVYYFGFLTENLDPATGQPLSSSTVAFNVIIILLASILGILGSYGVAWFGIRINTVANSRISFSPLKTNHLANIGLPLRSRISPGLIL